MNYKKVFITGGTGLVGSFLVEHFLNKACCVIFTSRDKTNAEKLLSSFDECSSVKYICIDHEEHHSTQEVLKKLCEQNIYPDVLINNARNSDYLSLKEGVPSRKEWLGEYLLDVIVPYELSMGLANIKGSKLKTIINISSMYGVVSPNPALYDQGLKNSPIQYGVAKSALIHLTKELAIRLSGKQIRVNSVSLGGIEGRNKESFIEKYAQLCPMGRMLNKSDVIGAINFLSSNESSGMTGHNLLVDGGWTTW